MILKLNKTAQLNMLKFMTNLTGKIEKPITSNTSAEKCAMRDLALNVWDQNLARLVSEPEVEIFFDEETIQSEGKDVHVPFQK